MTIDKDDEPDGPADGLVTVEADATENAVVHRLARNWHRRASVKRAEPDLDQLFEPSRDDYPPGLLPFADHPAWTAAPPPVRSRVLSWAWISFNRRTVTGEQQLANPAFELILEDAFPAVSSFRVHQAVAQALVDEQYHILMHRQGSAVTRRQRDMAMPDRLLPQTHTNRVHATMREAAADIEQRNLTTLAFATVSEVSINAYLGQLAHDPHVQPINTATVRAHLRDEYCHAEICSEVAKGVFGSLSPDHQQFFLAALSAALDAFVATDYTTWQRILDIEDFPQAQTMLDDVRQDATRTRLLRDYSGLYSLLAAVDARDRVDFDWNRSETSPLEKIVDDGSTLPP